MKRLPFLIAAFLLIAAAPVVAQDKPFNMLGSWSARGQGVGMGVSVFSENTSKGEAPSIFRVKLRVAVDKQEGSSFWGKASGEHDNGEPFLGALARDGKWGMFVSAHGGQQRLAILNATTIESCFARNDALRMSAACNVWTPTAVDPPPAHDKPIDMRGTWVLKGQGLGMGPSMFPEHAAGNEPRVFDVAIKFVVDNQLGGSFWGRTVASDGDSRPFLGAVTDDGKLGVTVTSAGVQGISVVDTNTIAGCFGGHAPTRVAVGCPTWSRQR